MKLSFVYILTFTFLCIAPTEGAFAKDYPINELPMYGGMHKPDVPKNTESSVGASKLGWKYFYNGDMATAMKRFNQAWMFDHDNPEAYWGFGLVLGARSRTEKDIKYIDESIKYLGIANKKGPKNAGILVDLAYSHTIKFAYLDSERLPSDTEYKKAKGYYDEARELAPKFPLLYVNEAALELYANNCGEARKLNAKALELGAPQNQFFEKDLQKCDAESKLN